MNHEKNMHSNMQYSNTFYAVTAFICGGLFAVGLMLSGLANPAKVIGFLDITGQWDASLIFVMLGAIMLVIIPMQRAIRKPCTITGQKIQLPTKTEIDYKLILGSVIFGIGWGTAGICPGPSFTLLGLGYIEGFYFVAAMSLGVWLQRKISGAH